MQRSVFSTRKSFLCIIFLVICFAAKASDESYIQTLTGKIKKGDSCTVIDDKFLHLPLPQWNLLQNLSVDNVISFELRNDTSIYYYNKSFSCILNVTIKYFTARDQQNPEQIDSVNLVVRYDTASGTYYPVNSTYRFKNAFKVIVLVNSIKSEEWGEALPAIFRVKNQILVKRKYPFNANPEARFQLMKIAAAPVQQQSMMMLLGEVSSPENGKLIVSWDPGDFSYEGFSGGPDEYDIEWVHIDRLSKSGHDIDNLYGGEADPQQEPVGPYTIPDTKVDEWMRFDNTRVTISSSSYTINLPYTEGYVIVRVRGIYYNPGNGLRLTTPWQFYEDEQNHTACEYVSDHEQTLNWQYTAAFAEEGKRKEVISYFDATLRTRQSVTLTNGESATDIEDDKAIVAETIYDNMGRPTLSILPFPVNDNQLKYYANQNLNTSQQPKPYSYTDITPGGTCSINAQPLNALSGASQYYSPGNPFINDPQYYFTKYVPDAQGHPFALTEYTNDNTGRIRRQGGVGESFQVGNGHETQYFYGKPLPKELYRLFGMEVGNSSHYLKNMVVDPNGQVSVSYIDANGRTIATALAGNAPPALDALPSQSGAITRLNDEIIKPGDFTIDAGPLVMQSTAVFLAPLPGDYQIHYAINPAALTTSPQNNAGFCSNCYYDVIVEIRNDCGDLLESAPPTPPFSLYDVSCNSQQVFNGDIEFTAGEIGEYTIVYKLRLSENAISYHTDYYIDNNSDLKTIEAFFKEELILADLKECYSECTSCLENLGSQQSFTEKMRGLIQQMQDDKYAEFAALPQNSYRRFDINTSPFKEYIDNWISSTYAELLANCQALLPSCQPLSPCEQKLERMKHDVTPGGQYALVVYNEITREYGINNDGTNVLMLYDTGIPAIDNLTYTDENGTVRKIKEPNEPYISTAKFIEEYFKHPEWADEFVKYHIEYCSYLWCTNSAESSYVFDESLREFVKDGADAETKGLFSRTYGTATAILNNNKDPFFAAGGIGVEYKEDMKAELASLSDVLHMTLKDANGNPLPAKNILQLIDWMLYTRPNNPNATITDYVNSWSQTPSIDCRSLTREWELYRNYYLQLKSKYVALQKQKMVPECTNCFVGRDMISEIRPAGCVNSNATSCPSALSFTLSQGGYVKIQDPKCVIHEWDEYITYTGPALTQKVKVKIIDHRIVDGVSIYTTYYATFDPGQTSPVLIGHFRTVMSEDEQCELPDEDHSFDIPEAPICLGSPTSLCETDPRYQLYVSKQRVFNEYVDMETYINCTGANLPSLQTQQDIDNAVAASVNGVRSQKSAELEIAEVVWLDRLKAVRNEEFASYASTTLTDAILSTIVTRLSLVSEKYIDTETNPNLIDIVSTLPSGTVSTANDNNFTEVFNEVLGQTLVQQGFGPDLLANVYPYDKKPLLENSQDGELTATICTNLDFLLNRFVQAGGTSNDDAGFHAYLLSELPDYTLTVLQLEELRSRCANGCRFMSNAVVLPAALTSADPLISCSDMSAFIGQFEIKYPNVTDGTKLYRTLFTNFINYRAGYAFSFEDYAGFSDQCGNDASAVLYDQPISPYIKIDEFACAADVIARVFEKAGQEYDHYVQVKRQEFRNRYISECLSTNASLKLEGDLYEYHYTLYYYDQAGNLVKTVPPEGVALLTDEQIEQVKVFNEVDLSTCTEAGAHDSEDHIATFNEFSDGLSSTTDKTKAVEVWLNNNSSDAIRQVRIITPDRKYFYQTAIYDKKLWVEIYKLNPGDPDDNTEIVLSNVAVADISSMPPLQPWTHLVVQSSTDLIGGQLELYMDGIKLTNLEGILPVYPFEWEIAASGPGYTLPGLEIGSLKHFRIYNRPALPGEVMANYQNPCLSPVGSLASGGSPRQFWGRFNIGIFCGNPGAIDSESIAEVPNDGSLQITSDPVAADNTITSVSNTFTVELWVKPTTTHEIDGQSTSGYAGLLGQHYAIYPTWGQQYGDDAAAMGISVGTNGVSVYEHSGNYMPALLVWTGVVTDWTHVAVVYENKTPKLYINGLLVKVGLTSNRQHIYPSYNFGKSYITWDFQGSLDEVRIWGNARSAQQISDNYNKAVLPNEAGLAGYWPMSQKDNGTINDISCNNLDFALAPGSQWHANTSPVEDLSIVEYTGPFIVPDHLLATTYEYNSLNQVVRQSSPDGGISEFWYDRLGRLVASQNAEQKTPTAEVNEYPDRYSYTKYDELGRIIEVGERYDYTSSSVTSYMTEALARTPADLETWFNANLNRQVTYTIYDEAPAWAPSSLAGLQHNLRKRVTATAIVPASDDILQRAAASYYNYDIMGNVSELVQENKELALAESQYITGGTGLKHIKYKYDLISGKVNKVLYQDGKWDQFYYQYLYDADNRVIKALSSRIDYADPNLWITEATYRYYLHGPLARMELGRSKVQGVDYAYTLQGWLKGVNGQVLDADKDMSRDGKPLTVFGETARDVYGFSLGYYHDEANGYKDYTPVGGAGANAFGLQYLPPANNIAGAGGKSLYNGNISHTTYAMSKLESGNTIGYSYRYDQLNRLTATHRHNIGTGGSNWNNSGIIDAYKEQVSYDANGNIKTYLRNGDPGSGGLDMDDLTYQYERSSSGKLISNKLRYVGDEVRGNAYGADLKTQTSLFRSQIVSENNGSQGGDNYQYDKIGNLVKDNTEHIDKIDWTVYGKINTIVKNVPGSSNTTIGYSYDAGGNRIGKDVQAGESLTNTYYVRDAQGNVMGIYKKDANAFSWQEQHLYGSSRIGMVNPNFTIATGQPLSNETYTGTNDPLDNGIAGIRNYELSNHLGNVLSVISDKKTGVDDGNGGIDYYIAEVLSQNDYYPGGMGMPGRKWDNGSSYQYGFGGKRKDNEMYGEGNAYDFGNRILDPRLGGRWLSVDPLQHKYPGESPYLYTGGNPIIFTDPDGRDRIITITMIGKDGKTTQIRQVDEKYFKYSWSLREDGFYFRKEDVQEHLIIDLRDIEEHARNSNFEHIVKFTSEDINAKYIGFGEYLDGKVRGNNSDQEGHGLRIYGRGHDANWQNLLPTAASGTESVDLGDWFSLAGALSPNQSPKEMFDKVIEKLGGINGNDMKNIKDAIDIMVKQIEGIVGTVERTKSMIEQVEKAKENSSSSTPTTTNGKAPHVYSGYKKGTILHTRTGNVRVDTDSTGTCCQDDKKATDTIPSLKNNGN